MVSDSDRAIEWSVRYVGLPFKSLGRDPSGLDCWGLIYLVYREVFQKDIPSYESDYADAYDSDEVGKLIRAEMHTKWQPVAHGTEMEGDVVLIRVKSQPAHLGVVVSNQRKIFLHSREGTDSCIERYDSSVWRRRVVGFFRYEE